MKAHAIVEPLSTKFLKVRNRLWSRVVIKADNDLLELLFLADLDLHDRDLRTDGGGASAG